MSKFGAVGLRPCQSAVNTTRKPSRGLATLRVNIWCDRAATLSKCCKYHTKTAKGFSNFPCQNLERSGCDLVKVLYIPHESRGRGLASFRVKIWFDRAATLSTCCKYHTKTESKFGPIGLRWAGLRWAGLGSAGLGCAGAVGVALKTFKSFTDFKNF